MKTTTSKSKRLALSLAAAIGVATISQANAGSVFVAPVVVSGPVVYPAHAVYSTPVVYGYGGWVRYGYRGVLYFGRYTR